MSLLDGVLGGAVGAEMATVVNSFIQQHGGVQGIVAQLEKQGLGPTVQSWVGTGANQPISPDQVHQAFGGGTLAQLAAKAGMKFTIFMALATFARWPEDDAWRMVIFFTAGALWAGVVPLVIGAALPAAPRPSPPRALRT